MNFEHYRGPVVYFATARCIGQCKIGYSDFLVGRAGSLSTHIGTPVVVEATIPGNQDVERFIHLTVWDSHMGGEWFNLSAEVETMIFEAKLTGRIEAVLNNFQIEPEHRVARWRYIGKPLNGIKHTKNGKPRNYALRNAA